MNVVARSLFVLLLGFGLLVVQSTVTAFASLHPYSPNLILPIVIYLGVAADVHVARGAFLSFGLGYLHDLFCGNLMGLQTFVMVATFLLARGAGLRLFLRAPIFQVLLTFLVGLLSGGAGLALRAIFETPAPFPAGTAGDLARSLAAPSLVTAVVAPLVFAAMQRVATVPVRRRDEAGVPA